MKNFFTAEKVIMPVLLGLLLMSVSPAMSKQGPLKFTPEIKKALGYLEKAVKAIEDFENKIINEKQMISKVVKWNRMAWDQIKVAFDKEKVRPKERLLGDAMVRFEWAERQMKRNGAAKRAHAMEYLHEAVIKLLLTACF